MGSLDGAGGATVAAAPASGLLLGRLPLPVASALAVVGLAAINVVDHLLAPPWWVAGAEAAVLLVYARLCGLSWGQLGLGRDRLGSGLRWGLGFVAVVGGVYLAGVLLPATRSAFQDSRYHLPALHALGTAFVVIPVGTVLLEEIAFRSMLWGLLARHSRTWQVLVTTSVLFGLWHILPSLHLASANRGVSGALGNGPNVLAVIGAVAFTTMGGLVFGELRRRSGSVLASALAHWSTNALGVLFGLLAWHLAGAG